MGGLLGATVAAVALLLVIAASGHAEAGNPNQYDCNGYIKAGEPEPLTEGAPIAYFFVCNGPITGYQIQSQIPLEGFEPAPLVENDKNEPVKETFSCGGETPGYAFNCVGSANAPGDQITGQFNVPGKLCAEPREDPLLTVTYAYLEAGVVTQAISGPFDLGRPHGCPADYRPRRPPALPPPAARARRASTTARRAASPSTPRRVPRARRARSTRAPASSRTRTAAAPRGRGGREPSAAAGVTG